VEILREMEKEGFQHTITYIFSSPRR
jgi:hypothetical protein